MVDSLAGGRDGTHHCANDGGDPGGAPRARPGEQRDHAAGTRQGSGGLSTTLDPAASQRSLFSLAGRPPRPGAKCSKNGLPGMSRLRTAARRGEGLSTPPRRSLARRPEPNSRPRASRNTACRRGFSRPLQPWPDRSRRHPADDHNPAWDPVPCRSRIARGRRAPAELRQVRGHLFNRCRASGRALGRVVARDDGSG